MPNSNHSNIEWCLMVFDKETDRIVTHLMLSKDQFTALRTYFGIADTDDHFGSYPVKGLSLFAEETVP